MMVETVLPILSKSSDSRLDLLKAIAQVDARALITITYMVENNPEFRLWVSEKVEEIKAQTEGESNINLDIDIEAMLKNIQTAQRKKNEGDRDGNA